MIPDEAVEAAAAGVASVYLPKKRWSDVDDEVREHLRRDARAALEAAAPHMMAEAEREAYNRGWGAGFRHTQEAMNHIQRQKEGENL